MKKIYKDSSSNIISKSRNDLNELVTTGELPEKDTNALIDYLKLGYEREIDKVRSNIVKTTNKAINESKNNLDIELNKIKQDFQSKQIEIIGLFVALFGFISVSFQIFSRVESVLIAGFFIFLTFCCLSSFAIIFSLLINKEFTSKKLIVFFSLLLISIFSIYVMRNENLSPTENTIKILISKNEEFQKTKTDLNNTIDELRTLKNCLIFNTPHFCSQK